MSNNKANKKFKFWTNFLLGVNIFTLIVGFLIAFIGDSFLFLVHNEGTSEVFNHGAPLDGNMLNLKNWLFGIIGATMIGFNILAIFIIENAFRKLENWAWNALFVGITLWFVVDTSISGYYGATYNIYLINIPCLVAYYIPLFMTKKAFYANLEIEESKA